MNFYFAIYYVSLVILTLLLARFVFKRYIIFAKKYNLVKPLNLRGVHKGNVFTGGGIVYAAVIMVAAVVLDNLDFVNFSDLSPVIARYNK